VVADLEGEVGRREWTEGAVARDQAAGARRVGAAVAAAQLIPHQLAAIGESRQPKPAPVPGRQAEYPF
jgi:hypothetical protein